MELRDILIYFAIKYEGDYVKIFEAIKNKEAVKEDEVNNLVKTGHYKCLTIIDEEYPDYFKSIYKPPFVLFYYGNISLLSMKNRIGVIGSREASQYGLKMTEQITTSLVEKKQAVIVSGLAEGIDHRAHVSTLKSFGNTIAVLGTGIDYCYPRKNIDTYLSIKEKGLLISEYPGRVNPEKKAFSFRNRIIAAISEKLIVVEAHAYSGTLVTTRYALDMGKEIYCVPYHLDEESECNRLISEGANILIDICDIF